jgi:release factor glutamine methyltransferase
MSQDRDKVWTIRDLMKTAMDHLQRHGIDEARLNVELLLAHAMDLPRISLYTSFDRPLNRDELTRFRGLFERRLRREPLQYIVGSANFMGLSIQVDSRVLIPRPETESLIEQVMIRCNNPSVDTTVNILEVGTGSGNIAVALVKYVKRVSVCTLDVSSDALEVARHNAVAHQVIDHIEFHHASIFDDIDKVLAKRFEYLVSNPPYVARSEWDGLQDEIRFHEPRNALTDEKDGLEFYRRIAEIAPYVLIDGGTILCKYVLCRQ